MGVSVTSDVRSRTSRFAKAGKEDRMRKQEAKIQCLIQEEHDQEFKEKVQSVGAWAFRCQTFGCTLKGKWLEKKNDICVKNNHRIEIKKKEKHFFVCINCGNKQHNFAKQMLKSCNICGQRKWRKGSAYSIKRAVDVRKERKKDLQTSSKPIELRVNGSGPFKKN